MLKLQGPEHCCAGLLRLPEQKGSEQGAYTEGGVLPALEAGSPRCLGTDPSRTEEALGLLVLRGAKGARGIPDSGPNELEH